MAIDETSVPDEDRTAPPSALVIFGASGDLARRKLFPGLANLARHKRLPDEFAVVGVGRSDFDDDAFRKVVSASASLPPRLVEQFRFVRGAYDDPQTYQALADLLADLDATAGTAGNRLFYLSTPAQAFAPIVTGLTSAGLNRAPDGGFARVLIEKPYGHDERSAQTARRDRARRVRRVAGLPDRPLPG